MDAEPVPDCEVAVLEMDWMVRIDPVGERVLERSGIVTAWSSTSLRTHRYKSLTSHNNNDDVHVPDCADPSDAFSRAFGSKPLNSVAVHQLERT